MKNIILASQSPRRKQLLEQAEIIFTIRTEHSDENYPADMPAEEVPLFIAGNKAKAVFEALTDHEQEESLIIAADTIVVLEGRIIGKPESEADALSILKSLSGKKHIVVTGVVLQSAAGVRTIKEVTEVYFNKLTDEQIEHYVNYYQPLDKAGAYAIQEWIGVIGIEKINGDFYNVMGLPVNKVAALLA
jgi:septum formation protein